MGAWGQKSLFWFLDPVETRVSDHTAQLLLCQARSVGGKEAPPVCPERGRSPRRTMAFPLPRWEGHVLLCSLKMLLSSPYLGQGHIWSWQWALVKVCSCCKQRGRPQEEAVKVRGKGEMLRKTGSQMVAKGTCPRDGSSLALKYEGVMVKELLSTCGCVSGQLIDPDLNCFLYL